MHGAPAEAWLWRPYRGGDQRPWAYCAEHLYGRWIAALIALGTDIAQGKHDAPSAEQMSAEEAIAAGAALVKSA